MYYRKDIHGKDFSWVKNTVGFRFGVYKDLETGELKDGFQTCAYLAEFPRVNEDDPSNLKYTVNQLSKWSEQEQVRMVYGFRITTIKKH